jgi:hypothetical protein
VDPENRTIAQALDEAADSAWSKLKETIGNQAARLLAASLQSLSLRQLAEVGAKILPGIERYERAAPADGERKPTGQGQQRGATLDAEGLLGEGGRG